MKNQWLTELIRTIPDFPEPGVQFKDITPLLLEPGALKKSAETLAENFLPVQPDLVAGIESRGFFLAPLLADILGIGVLAIRKKGKLPADTLSVDYELEYGTASLEVHKDQLYDEASIILTDDVLATGGTAAAAIELMESGGARVSGLGFLIELKDLGGRARLEPSISNIVSLVSL